MIPCPMEKSNIVFGPPPGTEGEVQSIPGFSGQLLGGACDGTPVAVVAWKPSPEDIARLLDGGPIYITMIGGLVPHNLSTQCPV